MGLQKFKSNMTIKIIDIPDFDTIKKENIVRIFDKIGVPKNSKVKDYDSEEEAFVEVDYNKADYWESRETGREPERSKGIFRSSGSTSKPILSTGALSVCGFQSSYPLNL